MFSCLWLMAGTTLSAGFDRALRLPKRTENLVFRDHVAAGSQHKPWRGGDVLRLPFTHGVSGPAFAPIRTLKTGVCIDDTFVTSGEFGIGGAAFLLSRAPLVGGVQCLARRRPNPSLPTVMAHMLYTRQEKQHICSEARRMMREGVKFAAICTMLELKPTTLRAWLNNQTRDWLYPQVPNQGRL